MIQNIVHVKKLVLGKPISQGTFFNFVSDFSTVYDFYKVKT